MATKKKTARTTELATQDYLLRGFDRETWARFRARVDDDGAQLRDVMTRLITAYADGALTFETTTTMRLATSRRK